MAKNTVFLLFRHAEKPDDGPLLSPAGTQHAQAYVGFLEKFHLGDRPLTVGAIFAAADTKGSFRPRLTVTPLAEALHLHIDTTFEDKQTEALSRRLLGDEFNGKLVVICWKHSELLDLAAALLGDTVLPKRAHWPQRWPDDEYEKMLQIAYGNNGAVDLLNTYCIQHPALS